MDKTLSELKQAESLVDEAIELLITAKHILKDGDKADVCPELEFLFRAVVDAHYAADEATRELYNSTYRLEKAIKIRNQRRQHESS